jgi:D-amino-acid dehydrogenase
VDHAPPPTKSPDVVVLGGGVIGAATAYELARRGARVSLLDRGQPAPGCSYGNAGLICPSHAEALSSPAAIRDGLGWIGRRDSPLRLRPRASLVPWLARFAAAAIPPRPATATARLRSLASASLELHAQLADSGLPTGFARRGILSVFESEQGFAAALGRLTAAPHQPEVLERGAARELEPALAPAIAGAIYHPNEAHCDPAALVGALLGAAEDLGADIRNGVEVLRLRRSNGRLSELETTAGSMRTGSVVLAAGMWTRALAAQVGAFVPLEAAKGYHVELEPGSPPVGMPIYMEEARVIATPLDGRLRVSGTLELSGFDLTVDPLQVATMDDAARRNLSIARNVRTRQVWRGLRPCTPDGVPVIGRTESVENLYLATGHAMLGITLAPVTGEIVANLLAGETPRYEIEPFAPSRFRSLGDGLRSAGRRMAKGR